MCVCSNSVKVVVSDMKLLVACLVIIVFNVSSVERHESLLIKHISSKYQSIVESEIDVLLPVCLMEHKKLL